MNFKMTFLAMILFFEAKPTLATMCNSVFSKSIQATVRSEKSEATIFRFQSSTEGRYLSDVIPLQDGYFVQSGGNIFRLKQNSKREYQSQKLTSLEGLESLIIKAIKVGDELWIMKHSLSLKEHQSEYAKHLHSLLEPQIIFSRDNGLSFQAKDMSSFKRSLDTPFGKFDEFAPINDLKNVSINGKPAVIINAGSGASAWISLDNGVSWRSIVREAANWDAVGYTGFFEIDGSKMFFGGEHPMDSPYLKYGLLDQSLSIRDFYEVKVPQLENRRIQFIRRSPEDKKLFFAGVEGGLLVSRDGGESWVYSFKEATKVHPGRKDRIYPYITHLVFTDPKNSNFVLAAGQPQSGLGTLLFSKDAGKTWSDLSTKYLPNNRFAGLNQDSTGKVLLTSIEDNEGTSTITVKSIEPLPAPPIN